MFLGMPLDDCFLLSFLKHTGIPGNSVKEAGAKEWITSYSMFLSVPGFSWIASRALFIRFADKAAGLWSGMFVLFGGYTINLRLIKYSNSGQEMYE